MNKFIKAIIDFCWEGNSPAENQANQIVRYSKEMNDFIQLAFKHYCQECNQFYKTVAGAAVHKRLKHNP